RGEEFDRGTLSLIDNQIDQTTGTLRLKATMPNKKRRLWPGQFVNMRVLTQVQHQVLTIPSRALERGPDGPFTYGGHPDPAVNAVNITTGEEHDGKVVVTKGLSAGDKVVASNQYRLQPGSHIKANAGRPDKDTTGPAGKPPEQAP